MSFTFRCMNDAFVQVKDFLWVWPAYAFKLFFWFFVFLLVMDSLPSVIMKVKWMIWWKSREWVLSLRSQGTCTSYFGYFVRGRSSIFSFFGYVGFLVHSLRLWVICTFYPKIWHLAHCYNPGGTMLRISTCMWSVQLLVRQCTMFQMVEDYDGHSLFCERHTTLTASTRLQPKTRYARVNQLHPVIILAINSSAIPCQASE